MRRIIPLLLLAVLVSAPVRTQEPPIFAGIWSGKDPGGVGGLLYDLTWDGLMARWKELGAANQYLADVEAYEVNGQRRYAALWRIGPGNGALYSKAWPEFEKFWNEAKGSQDLIDLEVIETGDEPRFLGVWRRKQEPHDFGAFWVDLTWEQLLARHKDLGGKQYLADVETYMRDGQRRYAGVWRAGSGNGAFYVMDDWQKFAAKKRELNDTQQMLDFEMYQSELGTWHFLGVWRRADSAGPLHASTSPTKFDPLTAGQLAEHWKNLQAKATLVGLTVVTPDIPPVTSLRGVTTCRTALRTATRARRTFRRSSSSRSRRGIAHGSSGTPSPGASGARRPTHPTASSLRRRFDTSARKTSFSRNTFKDSSGPTRRGFRTQAATATAAQARSSSSSWSAAAIGSSRYTGRRTRIRAAWPSSAMGCSWRRARTCVDSASKAPVRRRATRATTYRRTAGSAGWTVVEAASAWPNSTTGLPCWW